MAEFVPVAKLDDLKAETGHGVQIKGRLIGLFLHEGQIHAIDDTCPHMGAPLSDGHVCDGVVTCPWHAWRFRVTDGIWADAPSSSTHLNHYQTQVEGDRILLEVDW